MFKLVIQLAPPVVGGLEFEEALATFLAQIGIIKERTSMEEYRSEPGFKIFYKCFTANPRKPWLIKEIAETTGVSVPTVYRVLKKLRECDIVEFVEKDGAYRIRYGDLSMAWRFLETHVTGSMENYRKSVEYLQKMIEER